MHSSDSVHVKGQGLQLTPVIPGPVRQRQGTPRACWPVSLAKYGQAKSATGDRTLWPYLDHLRITGEVTEEDVSGLHTYVLLHACTSTTLHTQSVKHSI